MRGFAIAVAICALSAPARTEPRKLIAVLEFRNQLAEPARKALGDRLRFSERLRRELASRAPSLRVISRDEMQAIAQANPAALDRCHDDDCVEVGRLLGADLVVEGVLSPGAQGIALSLRVADTRARALRSTARVERRSAAELLEGIAGAAAAIAADLAPPAATR
jgi:TolB-like protein